MAGSFQWSIASVVVEGREYSAAIIRRTIAGKWFRYADARFLRQHWIQSLRFDDDEGLQREREKVMSADAGDSQNVWSSVRIPPTAPQPFSRYNKQVKRTACCEEQKITRIRQCYTLLAARSWLAGVDVMRGSDAYTPLSTIAHENSAYNVSQQCY